MTLPPLASPPSAETTTTRSATVGSMRYASATSVRRLPVTTTSGRQGRLRRADRSRISFAPSDMFGVVCSIAPSAGRTSGTPALAVASGMLRRPLARAAVDQLIPAIDVHREVRRVRARVDDDAGERRPAGVGQQHGVFSGPVVGRRIVRHDHRIARVDRQQSAAGEASSGVDVAAFAGGEQQGCGGGKRGQAPAGRQRSVSFMRSNVDRNTLCGKRAWNSTAARCASS